MSLAIPRTLTWPRVPTAVRSVKLSRVFDGERVAKVLIVMLFSMTVMRIASDVAVTHRATGLLLLASEALVVVFTMIRRPAGTVDRSWRARTLTIFSTFGPQLVRPASLHALVPDSFTLILSATGLIFVVLGKMSLGRSFGLSPANRGVVSTGLYRFARHPIYLGYLFTHIGFVIANAIPWNFAVFLSADVALVLRAVCEERTLALDPAYREYMQRVRWRLAPGLF